MQLQQNPPDAVASFSDFLLERFGLVASMQVAVITSVALHALVIIGVGFSVVDWRRIPAPHNVLDVVLVNSKTASKPVKPDALAQANLDGGGNTDEKRRASSPFPDLQDRRQQEREAQAKVAALEREAKQLLTQLKSAAKVPLPEEAAKVDPKAEAQARELTERTLEIARLEAQIKREYQAYQERPKRKFVGARTSEYRFANYVDGWRIKVERIGNLNYPEEAKRRQLYGSLQLTVAIKANGEIEGVEVNRSSGHKVLDQAAMRIVRLASPFERFPDAIRADTDILHITRTWTFAKGDQVTAE